MRISLTPCPIFRRFFLFRGRCHADFQPLKLVPQPVCFSRSFVGSSPGIGSFCGPHVVDHRVELFFRHLAARCSVCVTGIIFFSPCDLPLDPFVYPVRGGFSFSSCTIQVCNPSTKALHFIFFGCGSFSTMASTAGPGGRIRACIWIEPLPSDLPLLLAFFRPRLGKWRRGRCRWLIRFVINRTFFWKHGSITSLWSRCRVRSCSRRG